MPARTRSRRSMRDAAPDVGRELRFTSGGDELHRSQWDGWIIAYDARDRQYERPLGRLDWQSWKEWTDEDPPTKVERFRVKMVEVAPELRRHGIATRLYKRLFEEQGITEADLVPASLTPEGAAFRKGARLHERRRYVRDIEPSPRDRAIEYVLSQPKLGWGVALTTIPFDRSHRPRARWAQREHYPIETVPVADLVAIQVIVGREKVVEYLKNGWQEPILVEPHDGKFLIVDGHHRAYAASLLGDETIDAYVAPESSERQHQALAESRSRQGQKLVGSRQRKRSP